MCTNIGRYRCVYRHVTFASFVCIAGLCQAFVPALHMNTHTRTHISLHMCTTCLAHVHTQVYKHVCTHSYSHVDTYRLILLYACATYGNANTQTHFYAHVSAKLVCLLSFVTHRCLYSCLHMPINTSIQAIIMLLTRVICAPLLQKSPLHPPARPQQGSLATVLASQRTTLATPGAATYTCPVRSSKHTSTRMLGRHRAVPRQFAKVPNSPAATVSRQRV